MSNCQTYTLAEVVENYLIDRSISKKKYFAPYTVMAKKEWQKLFRTTIWTIQSRWMTMQAGEPFNYVFLPEGTSRLLGVGVEDRCHLIQPLFYNDQLNVIAKPTVRKCGCNVCECGGICTAANSMTYTTKLLFTINDVDYYEKTWQELCPNGDILEYKETPTKKYNNLTGDAGDYSADYNDDYSLVEPPFSDYTIVTVTSQRKICKLEVAICGCPIESESNACLLTEHCGCNINWNCGLKRRCCTQYFTNINNNHYGQIKISECGQKIYYQPSHNWRKVTDVEFPKYLLVNYQTNGLQVDSATLVPDYAIDVMEAGINWRSLRFNSSVSKVVKDDAYQQYEMEVSSLISVMNPMSLIEMGLIQDQPQRW